MNGPSIDAIDLIDYQHAAAASIHPIRFPSNSHHAGCGMSAYAFLSAWLSSQGERGRTSSSHKEQREKPTIGFLVSHTHVDLLDPFMVGECAVILQCELSGHMSRLFTVSRVLSQAVLWNVDSKSIWSLGRVLRSSSRSAQRIQQMMHAVKISLYPIFSYL